jgi:hypothetical protein
VLFSNAMRVLPFVLAGVFGASASLVAHAQATGQAAVEPATYVGGEVMFVSGTASRKLAGGATNPVTKGMTLLEGDRIHTAADSHVYVRLRDGGLLVVRPASELHVDRWRFDPAQPQQSQIKYTLESGMARHVSGQGAKAARDKFRFNTPVAAIGVRGTDFTVLADPAVTRVSVQTGGVIVNGLGGGCRAEAFGPCDGDSAVELFASAKDKLVQLRSGERHAEIIEMPATQGEKARAVATAEPATERVVGGATVVSEARTRDFVDQANLELSKPPEAPEPITIASWGRWQGLADSQAGYVPAATLLDGRDPVAINSHYLLASNRLQTPSELPGAGSASFKLIGHDGLMVERSTGREIASVAGEGTLRIDFGTRRFETSLPVQAGSVSTTIDAKGSVDRTGRLASDLFVSQSIIQGLVGGKNAAEAVYLYQKALNGQFDFSGVAAWRVPATK